jgi:hypothetical protein
LYSLEFLLQPPIFPYRSITLAVLVILLVFINFVMVLMEFVLLPDFAGYFIALSWCAFDRLIDFGVGRRSRLRPRFVTGQLIALVEIVALEAGDRRVVLHSSFFPLQGCGEEISAVRSRVV